ncbi:MAG: SPOR domain-containing protein [Gammaproteobacteria bacterium]|nr:SPOR domain-containing protein [Gammaproteobacteria bacterium]MBU2676149.1 SPOR domain-containing protein [Gammaproteobacteria bacterium]NNC57039.1 SPOR domain-containing protein [Woeseiaceae bacterium]NNL49885.1 SPOR domain-containing protein [Woeseiaceae bacterium]
MAKRKKRRVRRSKKSGYPPFVWMLFGLAIGLSVAVAVYVKDREPAMVAQAPSPRPASLPESFDDNREGTKTVEAEESTRDRRFTFYDILPNFEVVTPDEEPDIAANVTPKAIEEPGVYVLQAGSFSTNNDADRRRAELALHGIESHIQRVKVNDRDYHRVYIGPTDDLDELNMLRSRLRAAKIDVFRIRLSD